MYWGFTHDGQILNMQALALNGEWENAIILNIYFDTMSWIDYSMCSYKKQIGFTNKFSLGLFPKKCSKKNVCMTMSYILLCVRNQIHIYKSRIHIWKRTFLLKVNLSYDYKDSRLEICYVVLEKYMGWVNFQYQSLWENFANWCEFICTIYLFNFQMKANLGLWQMNLKHFMEFLKL